MVSYAQEPLLAPVGRARRRVRRGPSGRTATAVRPTYRPPVFVYDLRHVLELPDGTPDQIVGLTELLKDVVRAGTAAAAVGGWVSALPCRRRRGRRRCPGRILIRRSEPPTPIVWECTFCGEEGSVDGWQDTSYDLRDRSPWSTDPEHDVSVSHDTATSLRELTLLDVDCERVIYGARSDGSQVILTATDEQLEKLLGYLASAADQETNRGRRLRLGAAYDELRSPCALR